MIQVSGFGEDGSTIPQTVGAAKLYREHLEGRLRKNSYVLQKQENPSEERRNFMTALTIGNDYRASLAMFLSSPLSDQQIAKERRRAEEVGLGFKVTNTVMYEHIVLAAPPSLTINMEGEGTTGSTNCWTTRPQKLGRKPRFSPSRRFLSDDYRCSSGFLNRITDTIMPHKTIIRLPGVARNPANGFPARLLAIGPHGGGLKPPMHSPMGGRWKMARTSPLTLSQQRIGSANTTRNGTVRSH